MSVAAAEEPALVEAVERVVFASVGITVRALAATPTAAVLTLPQWRLLALLHHDVAPRRLRDIAGTIGMSMPSASRLVSRLAARSLVTSERDADDRRAIRVELTRTGTTLVEEVMTARRRLVAEQLAGIDAPPSLAPHMDRIADALALAATTPFEPLEAAPARRRS